MPTDETQSDASGNSFAPSAPGQPDAARKPNPFTESDAASLLCESGWASGQLSQEQLAWCARAAALLGPHCADRAHLQDLLRLVFAYDARAILSNVESHVVLSRSASRDVLRRLALLLLDGAPVTSDRFQEIVQTLKSELGVRARELFHPLRLALAGRAGEGELDRVILLLEDAAALPFAVRVKTPRERILDFCAALD